MTYIDAASFLASLDIHPSTRHEWTEGVAEYMRDPVLASNSFTLEFYDRLYSITLRTTSGKPSELMDNNNYDHHLVMLSKMTSWIEDQWPQGGGAVLDFGCGSGIGICCLALHSPEKRFVGVDFSEAALAVARTRAQRLNLQNIEWMHQEASGRHQLI